MMVTLVVYLRDCHDENWMQETPSNAL